MIPLQITLDGFMSYRDAQTLRFEGATLWLLCGRNGAGKSTVFDAIKFALFATHRGGTQGADALIHHDKTSFKVAFDFQSGGQTYRVIRTRGRKGRPTVQALQQDDQAAWQPVAETHMEEGFRVWLGATLGLTEATFVASTLLQQGKSDALLEAPPVKRHEMLLEIVDLAPYEALAKKADERRKAAHAQAELLERRLHDLPEVAEEMVEEARQNRDACLAQLNALGPRRDTLLQLVPRAERWAALQIQLQELEGELAAFRAQEERATQIERDATRLEELNGVMPLLERAQELGVRGTQTARDELAARAHLGAVYEARAMATQSFRAGETELKGCETRMRTLQSQRENALAQQLQLAPLLRRVEEWERECAAVERAAQALSALGAGLDADLDEAEAALNRARCAESALPSLRRLASVATETRTLYAQRTSCENAVRDAMDALTATQAALMEAEATLNSVTQVLDAARAEAAQERARCTTAQDALCRFEQVEGEARCGYCGQELSPEHRAWEHSRLNQLLSQTTEASRYAEDVFESAIVRHDMAQTRLKQETNTTRARETRLREEENALRSTEEALQRLSREAGTLRAELSPEWASRANQADANEESQFAVSMLSALFQTASEAARSTMEWQARVSELQERRGQRAALRREHESAQGRSQELAEALGEDAQPTRVAALRATVHTAAHSAQEATAALTALEPTRTAATQARDEAERALRAVHEAEAQAQRDEAVAGAQREEVHRATEVLRAQAPETWRAHVEALLSERENAEPWQAERGRLQRADALGALRRWQGTLIRAAELQRVHGAAQSEAETVTPEARRPVPEIKAEIAQLGAQAEACEAQTRAAERELRARETEREAHVAAEAEAAEANRERDLYRTLSEALGRDGLQRRLLQEAEDTIVEHANAVLDRLSAGTLRLEVRREAPNTNGMSAQSGLNPTVEIKQKALDLVAYDASSGDGSNPIPTAFLSGSQKFRVSVALAIGIGNYGARGGRRVESVIIDEGFGSLDTEGRGAMIEELHALGELLQRVIVVSHQEDFAAAFPNRYRITQEGGASKALLQSGSE